jgi:hypothetical protein
MGFGDGRLADLRGDLYLFGIPYGPGGKFSAGSWAALDPATGSVLWQVADPNASVHLGPITVANVNWDVSQGARQYCRRSSRERRQADV